MKSDIQTEAAKFQRGSLFADKRTRSPWLLVSVRSRQEAGRAIEGGADILDVKEPFRGSLGMASLAAITDISSLDPVISKKIPFSVALGEVIDWSDEATVPSLPAGITFAKLGLSQCAFEQDWSADWMRVREAFARRSASDLNWVAVAYADSGEAASPAISDVIEAAVKTNCAGFLIDTWKKDGRTLLDHISIDELTKIAIQCHTSGLFLALAGRLNETQLQELTGSDVAADVIAIRSAGCRGHDRTAEIETQSVAAFKKSLRQRFLSAEIA